MPEKLKCLLTVKLKKPRATKDATKDYQIAALTALRDLLRRWPQLTIVPLKTHTPQIWRVKIHPPNLGGESSDLVLQCFLAFTP